MDQTRAQPACPEERRDSFRVEDVLPIACRRLPPDLPCPRSSILPGFSEHYLVPSSCEEPPDETVSPQVWRMLVEIHERLGLILHKLHLESDGTSGAEPSEISLSTRGVKFSTGERFEVGDWLEVKILLPLEPPAWIVLYGKVVRMERREADRFDVGVHFSDTDEAVSEAINHYALKRQRELIRKRKGN